MNDQFDESCAKEYALDLIDKIYKAVLVMAPYAVNTTAWYDAGVPILSKAILELVNNRGSFENQADDLLRES